jgi:diacylglycerol kinase family enzyme
VHKGSALEAAGEDVFIQVDGELAGQLPARIEIVEDALTLMMPAEYR